MMLLDQYCKSIKFHLGRKNV